MGEHSVSLRKSKKQQLCMDRTWESIQYNAQVKHFVKGFRIVRHSFINIVGVHGFDFFNNTIYSKMAHFQLDSNLISVPNFSQK